jgi:hypothetical protein
MQVDVLGRRVVPNLSEMSKAYRGNRKTRRSEARYDRRNARYTRRQESAFARTLRGMKAKFALFAGKK